MEFIHSLFYWLITATWVRLVVKINIKGEISGRENIPRKGPLIIASNHINEADPPIIAALIPRRIVWMGKQELFDILFFGGLYHLYGAIPVRRFQADLKALRKAQEALRKGLALGMFPEGTRSRSGHLGKGEPGTALIALRTGAPILPIGIAGTETVKLPWALFKRTPVRVAIGEPFTLPKVDRIRTPMVEEGTETIMRRIAALLPPQYRGVYAAAVASS